MRDKTIEMNEEDVNTFSPDILKSLLSFGYITLLITKENGTKVIIKTFEQIQKLNEST